MKPLLLMFIFSLFLPTCGLAATDETAQLRLRQLFLQAERQVGSASAVQVKQWLTELEDYPLQPYIEQRWLQRQLHAHNDIARFLEQHQGSPLDWPLRRPWLMSLAKAQQSERFLQNFPGSNDAELSCIALTKRLRLYPAERAQVWRETESLWIVGKSQPRACDPLFNQWRQAEQLKPEMVLRRIQLAAEANELRLVRFLKTLLPVELQYLADLWIQVRQDPAVIARARFLPGRQVYERDILTYALKRLVWRSPDLALQTWRRFESDPYFTSAQRLDVQRQFAIALANKGDQRAALWLDKLPAVHLDNTLAQWQVGAALRSQDWPRVQQVIENFPPELASDINWRYWLARALEQQGQMTAAHSLFQDIAQRRHFYGFMAAARLGLPPSLAHNPVAVSEQELVAVQQHPVVQRAQEWLALGRLTEARREWNFLQRTADPQQLLAAAKLASQIEWHERAIFTLANAGYWDDVELRFPLAFKDEILRFTRNTQVASGWAMAIARRESSFMPDANSPVGARGIMQIMPDTAHYIARQRVQLDQLYNPVTNIDYGVDYLNYLLQRNDGNLIVATAAYNAGFGRVRQWIPQDQAVPVDVWVETIPFRETREYVKAVMAYYQIYNIRLNEPHDVFQALLTMQIGGTVK